MAASLWKRTCARGFSTSCRHLDHYSTLAIDSSATKAQVKAAFIKWSKHYHPDLNHEKDAKEHFQQVGEAYQVLGNDRKRREYDRERSAGMGARSPRRASSTAPTAQPWAYDFGASTHRGQAGQSAWAYRQRAAAGSSRTHDSSRTDYWNPPRYPNRPDMTNDYLRRSRSNSSAQPGGFGLGAQHNLSKEEQLRGESVIWKVVQVLSIIGMVVFISGGFKASADGRLEEEIRIDPMTGKPCRICNSLSQMQNFSKKTRQKKQDEQAPATPPIIDGPQVATPTITAHNCPLDREELGRNTWAFLHTMASYFPEQASTTEHLALLSMLRALPHLYPCPECAHALAQEMQDDPPEPWVRRGRRGVEEYLCRLHNEVNERLGKEAFDCRLVGQRWRDGPSDGRCD